MKFLAKPKRWNSVAVTVLVRLGFSFVVYVKRPLAVSIVFSTINFPRIPNVSKSFLWGMGVADALVFLSKSLQGYRLDFFCHEQAGPLKQNY